MQFFVAEHFELARVIRSHLITNIEVVSLVADALPSYGIAVLFILPFQYSTCILD